MFFKVKLSHFRPGQVLKAPTNSKRLAEDGSNIVSHKHRPAFTPKEISLVFIYVRS